jgi:hypothetical protein
MTFEAAERVADAVLYEGYVLYPYRASAIKNKYRWQFGVIAPQSPHEDQEPSFAQTECLIERKSASPRLLIRVRFLRPQTVERDSQPSRAWLEGISHALDFGPLDLNALSEERQFSLSAAGVDARLTLVVRPIEQVVMLRARIENLEAWQPAFDSDRDAMLERSLVGTHLLLGLEDASFVSLVEPPDDAAAAVERCQNRHTWPVLIGDPRRCDLMLSSPIVLYDFPSVARESPGDLFDAAEIDEILSLRILTMTDEEKEEARSTDPRARALLDRVESLTPEAMAALHGTIRNTDFFNPAGASPDLAFVMVRDRRIAKGSHVRLQPNRRADAMDLFLKDQAATVAGIYRDVDERVYVAVTVDADPAASLHESFGRFFYFDPAEVEPIDAEEPDVVSGFSRTEE